MPLPVNANYPPDDAAPAEDGVDARVGADGSAAAAPPSAAPVEGELGLPPGQPPVPREVVTAPAAAVTPVGARVQQEALERAFATPAPQTKATEVTPMQDAPSKTADAPSRPAADPASPSPTQASTAPAHQVGPPAKPRGAEKTAPPPMSRAEADSARARREAAEREAAARAAAAEKSRVAADSRPALRPPRQWRLRRTRRLPGLWIRLIRDIAVFTIFFAFLLFVFLQII